MNFSGSFQFQLMERRHWSMWGSFLQLASLRWGWMLPRMNLISTWQPNEHSNGWPMQESYVIQMKMNHQQCSPNCTLSPTSAWECMTTLSSHFFNPSPLFSKLDFQKSVFQMVLNLLNLFIYFFSFLLFLRILSHKNLFF